MLGVKWSLVIAYNFRHLLIVQLEFGLVTLVRVWEEQLAKPFRIIQTEAERRRREAGVKQSMEIRVGSCMYVCMYVCMWVWYLELSREPRHVAQQTRYQNVGLGNGHCLGTISPGCDF